MFIIGEAIVEAPIAHERFACDVARCKGACCTLPGGRGAPLDDDEVAELHKAFPAVRKYLSSMHLQVIAQMGYLEGTPGNFATTCVEDRDCVFVYYDGGSAKCALERAYNEGETTWRKPISCHLFPIRIKAGRVDHLRYEKIHECRPAAERGSRERVPLYMFMKDALVRKYGEVWYEAFRTECERQDRSSSRR